MRRRPCPRRLAWAAAPLLCLAVVAAWPGDGEPGFLVNESRSLPRGLYLRDAAEPIRPGSIVAVSPPREARAYLASLGAPGDVILLKRVAAVPGDPVCSAGARLYAGRRSVRVPERDRRGVVLRRWRGCGRLDATDHLVLGDTPTSYDGRYFGPVPRRALSGPYRQVLAW